MTTYAEGKILSDVILWEEERNYSRDVVTVIMGQNLAMGTVLGRITASGKVTILAPGASDGSQNAVGILINAVNATAADKPGLMYAREAIVKNSGLVWPGGISGPEQTAATAQLKTLGILIRMGV